MGTDTDAPPPGPHHKFEFVVSGLTPAQAQALLDLITLEVEYDGATLGGGFALADENGELPGEAQS